MKIKLFGLALFGIVMIAGCGPDPTIVVSPNTPPANAVVQTSANSDAIEFISTMQPYVDQYNGVANQFSTFIKGFNAGRYSATAIQTQMGNMSMELEKIQLGLAGTIVPVSMQANEQKFLQCVTDLDSATQNMQTAAIDSISGDPKQDISNANALYKQSVDGMIQFLKLEQSLQSGTTN